MANTTGKKTKGSGRKKGTPNKRTLDAKALAEKIGCDPLEVLLRGAAGDWKWFGFKEKSLKIGKATVRDNITYEERIDAAFKAAPFVHGKIKYVEHSGSINGGLLERVLGEIDGSISEDDEDEE